MSNRRVLPPALFVFRGAVHGLLAWMAYGLLEFVVTSVAPLVTHSNAVFAAWDWQVTRVLLGVYAVAGLVLGGLGGFLVQRVSGAGEKAGKQISLMAAGTLGLGSLANLLTNFPLETPEEMALASTVFLIVALVYGGSSPARYERWGVLGNPWAASAILLVPPMVAADVLENRPAWVQIAAALLLLSAIAVACRVGRGVFRKLWPDDGRLWIWRHAGLLAMAAFAALGSAVALNGSLEKLLERAQFPAPVRGLTNVILITLDTVQANHLSLYGYSRKTTPRLEEFARQATVYTRAIAASDMTLPSHASIWTGLYPREHGAHTDPPLRARPLAAGFETIDEMLAAKGYTTLAVAANRFYLQPEWGLAQGFHLFDSQAPVRLFNMKRRFLMRQGARNLLGVFVSTYAFDVLSRRAAEINEDIFQLLKKMKREDRSFFLFANYMDAHSPYIPPAPYDQLFPGKDRKLSYPRFRELRREIVTLKRHISERERAHLVSQYDGGIAYLDFHISRLIAALKQWGLYDNTLLIITGDHGEAFGERNLMEHAVSVYQDQVHVPLLIKYPHQTEGQVVTGLASHVDLLPTVLDVLGYAVPKQLRGMALNRMHPDAGREVVSASYPSVIFYDVPRLHELQFAIYSGYMKFIHSMAGKRELYNLSDDPQEKNNLYHRDAAAPVKLEADLNVWLHEVKPHASARAEIAPENLQRLKSLGYVQ